MSIKIVIFAVAVFACQANAQLGMPRPFATGFANGFTEMAKPFVQLGQTVMSPTSDYFSGDRRPQAPQWMPHPPQMMPQAQPAAYEGYEALTSGMPGPSYTQVFRPRPNFVFKPPPPPHYPVPSQDNVPRPPRPHPVPFPVPVSTPASSEATSSSSEESDETYVPSSLLVEPDSVEASVPKPETSEENIDISSSQSPLPTVEDDQ